MKLTSHTPFSPIKPMSRKNSDFHIFQGVLTIFDIAEPDSLISPVSPLTDIRDDQGSNITLPKQILLLSFRSDFFFYSREWDINPILHFFPS